jgi:hypothetical protein
MSPMLLGAEGDVPQRAPALLELRGGAFAQGAEAAFEAVEGAGVHAENGVVTDLYAVRVLAVDAPRRRIQLRVTAINPDVWHGPLPDDASFFLSDLEEDETILDLLVDEDGVDDDFVESVERNATRNYPFTAEAEERLFESGSGFPWEDEVGPFNEMSPESAAAFLRCEEMRVGADYDVVVTDSRLIEHLKAGLWWRTAAYPGAD